MSEVKLALWTWVVGYIVDRKPKSTKLIVPRADKSLAQRFRLSL